MTFTASKLLALISGILFILAAFGVAFPVVEIQWLAAAFLAFAFVV